MVYFEDHFDLEIYYKQMKNVLELKNHHFHSKIETRFNLVSYYNIINVFKLVHILVQNIKFLLPLL
jgi:hypothetical protein